MSQLPQLSVWWPSLALTCRLTKQVAGLRRLVLGVNRARFRLAARRTDHGIGLFSQRRMRQTRSTSQYSARAWGTLHSSKPEKPGSQFPMPEDALQPHSTHEHHGKPCEAAILAQLHGGSEPALPSLCDKSLGIPWKPRDLLHP